MEGRPGSKGSVPERTGQPWVSSQPRRFAMDPTTSCNLICPKGQPPSSVLVPGRDRRDGSMEGRPGSKGSVPERTGHFASKGDPFGWGVGGFG